MSTQFVSDGQAKLFQAVVTNLERLGYAGELLRQRYTFVDWFDPHSPERILPAAAFGQLPQSYDSACFAVLLANGLSGQPLIAQCRALGAPLAFEITTDAVVSWRVGREPNTAKDLLHVSPGQIDRVFEDHAAGWRAADLLRTKEINFNLGPRQLDFIDLGLLPALEAQITSKLDRILREIVRDALAHLERIADGTREQDEAVRSVYRLIFRFLAAKVLHDREVAPFRDFDSLTPRQDVLSAVTAHYGESPTVQADAQLKEIVASNIWTRLDFRNLSVEVLAYVYENTFVADEVRDSLGTHSTPYSLARYIVRRVPFEKLEPENRRTLEPFCGHGIFLVAALQRLRELLPPTFSGQQRHKYFVRMLRGFEVDAFALEVSRLCLMLADIPNPNGWRLDGDDIFGSRKFTSAIAHSHVVLSNPPFENFSNAERSRYGHLRSTHKPAHLLDQVLESLPPGGMVGMILPKQFIDGRSYRNIRGAVAKRFAEVEIVSLPDRVFAHSAVESAVLIGTGARTNRNRLTVSFKEVLDRDRQQFLSSYVPTRSDEDEFPPARAEASLRVTRFQSLWERLCDVSPLRTYATVHRGVEWRAPFREDLYVSTTPRPGFQRGFWRAEGLIAFEPPQAVYLNTAQRFRRGGAFDYLWSETKILMNAVRQSRGPWKIAAFVDNSGSMAYQNFHAIWPRDGWTPLALAAVLNSPIANAFVDAHESSKHIRKQTVESIPLPNLAPRQVAELDQLAGQYLAALPQQGQKRRRGAHALSENSAARDALLAVDAFVLRSYRISPRQERELLELFRGSSRPVPFDFGSYYREEFNPTLPLWMYTSPDFRHCRASELLSKIPRITDPALIEALEEAAE